MKKCWIAVLLVVLLVGCTQKEEKPEVQDTKLVVQVPNPSPAQNLKVTATEIVQRLQDLQIVLGETEIEQLQNVTQLGDQDYKLAVDQGITVQILDGLVNMVTYNLQEPVTTDSVELNFSATKDVQGQWQTNNGQITALQLKLTNPTFKQQVYGLSLEEKVGQMLMIGMEGTTLSTDLKQALAHHIGNVILFKKNIVSVTQLRKLITQIDDASSDYPVWVGIDEEGGLVSRLPKELVKLPTAQKLAQNFSPEEVEEIAHKLGEALAENGIDIDFAPIMDVNSNPNNPIIGNRAYSANADEVIDYSGHFANGIKEAGVLAVAKHFPGHGDTSVDSHKDLPVINKSLAELESVELRPFKAAVENGIDSIMVGHLLVPALDAQKPASLSSNIITGLLRNEWGYDGIVISDDLTMGALHLSLPQAILQSIEAGNDIALANGSLVDVLEGEQFVVQAVEAGEIPLQQINASAYRILSHKKQQPLQEFSVERWNSEMRTLLHGNS